MEYHRQLNLLKLLDSKSHFLFGARGTGKSTLVRKNLKDIRLYDLLNSSDYQRLLRNPQTLREELYDHSGVVAIDEIQKLPQILDEVHWIIENRKNTFLLTGSSARKLKHGGANLLAGRAWMAHLFPLTSREITDFDLVKYLNQGGLPTMYLSTQYEKELENYVDLYIREEIKAEAVTRHVDSFVEFIDLLALSNGEEINIASFSSDCGLSATAIKSYFSILEDSQTGFAVPGFTKTKKRKAISRSKFFFFDVGVVNFLAKRKKIEERSELFGRALEHFVAMELRAAIAYNGLKTNLNYWRSTSQMEVDFVLPGYMAVEVKASHNVQDKSLKGLRALKEEKLDIPHFAVVSMDLRKRQTSDGITIWPALEFLDWLWSLR